MSELSNFLVESILGESAEMDNVIVVYSGRFQPFHKGHFATYQNLTKKFGKDNVYIATSNKTDNQKSPFDFREKKTIMTKMFGIQSNKIVQVKNPYAPTEILSKYDAAKTGFITVVGEKDEQRLGGNYFTPYKGKVELGYLDKGYVYASPSQSNPISGTDVRNWLGKGSDEEKKEGFLKAYPKFDATVFKFITLKLAKLSEDINLDVNVGDTLLMGKFKNKRVVVKNIDKDEHGMPTINGKKATTFRIPPKSNLFNESSLGGYSAEAGEPETGYVADGQKRLINKAKPEPWFKQGGYKQLHVPQGDWIRGKGKDRDKDSTFRKVYYKVTNIETSDLDPAKDPHKVEDWKEVKSKKKIKKPKRFWEDTEMDTNLSLISEEDLNEIVEDYITALDEMGLGGGAGVGLSLPGGFINGAPKADDVAKVSKKLKNNGMSGYEEVDEIDEDAILEYSGNNSFDNDMGGTTGTNWNSDWDDYDDAGYYLDNLDGWSFFDEIPSEREKKKAVDQELPLHLHGDGKTDKYNRILKYNSPKPEDLTEMVEMAKSDLDQVEKYADQQLSPEDIELGKESDHFFQRLNDPRNGKQISAAELTGFFKRLAKNKKKFLDFVKQYKEFVVKDNRTKINIPFMAVANKLIAKTIMRKDDFKSSTPVYTTEEIIVEIAAGIYAGKLKINGEVVPIEVELLGADNKTKEFITKIIHIDKKYQSKLPIGSTFKIPARIFRMPGGGWYKIKSSAFKESLNEVKWEGDTFAHCMQGQLPLSLNIVKQLVDPIKTTSLHVTTIENLPKVAALEGTKKSISTFNKIDKYSKIVQNGKGVDTDGGVFVVLSGVVLAQSIMDLWTAPDKQGRRWVNPGTIIADLGRERDVVFNFAPHLKPFKKRWKEDPLNEFTPAEKNEFIRLYYKEAEKFMLSKKKEFQDKYLNSNQLYYESDWNEVVLNQIKIEKILAIPSNWNGDEAENQKKLKKLKQKYPKVEVGKNTTDIQNFIRNNGGSIRESINQTKTVISEGGAYGHMHHPFDIEMNLTFSDLKNIVKKALTGDLDVAREKTDGQALAISWVNGRLVAARNKSHLKNKGEGAMTIGQVADKFDGRGGLTDAYNFAMSDLSKAIGSLSEPQRKKVFNDGSSFMNLEVIYPTSVNVIPYNQPLLVFHGTFDYDMDGNITGENQTSARILAGMIKQVNGHVQSKYTIQGPPMQKLPKSDNLSKLQSKYMSMISKLQSEFGLGDSAGVADYHQAWWSNFVDKNAKGLDAQEKIGLVKRWAFGDKGFRIATIQDPKLRSWADNTEKKDQAKIAKDNLMKFEEIFLGVGADVLSFMESVLTANPTEATKQMVARLHSTIKTIKSKGTPKQLEKLKLELNRLNSIGGFEKIVPNEGIVFVYNGNTFKLTGAFASLNQILGIFYE